jgi:hypothetical protein
MDPRPEPAADLLSACHEGMVFRTRDRRAARICRLEPAAGLIHGEVEMQGACVWRADGRWRDAPFGAPGPLDLMPLELGSAAPPRTASVTEAIEAGNPLFCCD